MRKRSGGATAETAAAMKTPRIHAVAGRPDDDIISRRMLADLTRLGNQPLETRHALAAGMAPLPEPLATPRQTLGTGGQIHQPVVIWVAVEIGGDAAGLLDPRHCGRAFGGTLEERGEERGARLEHDRHLGKAAADRIPRQVAEERLRDHHVE